ncbi:uncharacterized protein [Prorops nasuta]|uniref:uncharacterized protein n=1 Tax=Prorops nasuta TaxID=863751 RepID=UPI0034CDE779
MDPHRNNSYDDTFIYNSEKYNDELEEESLLIHEDICFLNKDFEEILIDLIKDYPHLYDTGMNEYKDAIMKENSWMEIAKALNSSVANCKRRWLRLRERFTNEKRLQDSETKSGSGASHRSSFPYLGNMSFLEKFIKRRKSYSNCIYKSPNEISTEIIDEACNNNVNESVTKQYLRKGTFIDLTNDFRSNINMNNISSKNSIVSLIKTLQNRMTADRPSNEPILWNQNLSPDQSFGILVATEISRLPDCVKRRLKKEILQLLWRDENII